MYQVCMRTPRPSERNGQIWLFEATLGEAVQLVSTPGSIVGFLALTFLWLWDLVHLR